MTGGPGRRVLVTDGDNRIALAAVRALSRAGWSVTSVEQETLARRGRPICFRSRHVAGRHLVPAVEQGGVARIAELSEGHDVVLPVSIDLVLAVAAARSEFERRGVRVPVPPPERILAANDKDRLMALAAGAGVPTPPTFRYATAREAARAAETFRYPAVVKLREDSGRRLPPAERYAIARDAAAFMAAWVHFHALKPGPVVQEFVDGDGYGFSALRWDGRFVAELSHRRVREYPAAGGPSACCETVEEPALSALGRRVLDALDWKGVAMVEFRRARATGNWFLLEVNPRLWGSLPLAEAAGVNFPDLLCRCALGESPGPAKARSGVRLQFAPLDLLYLFRALGTPGRRASAWGAAWDLLNPRVREGLFEWGDPWPAMGYLATRMSRQEVPAPGAAGSRRP